MSKGHGGGGPAIVKAPDPEMKTIEQSNALSAQKRRQGLLSTLLGAKQIEEEDKGNATAITGKEYLSARDEYLKTVAKPVMGQGWKGQSTAAKILAGAGAVASLTTGGALSKLLGGGLIGGAIGSLFGSNSKKKAEEAAYNQAMNAYNEGLNAASGPQQGNIEKYNKGKKKGSTSTSSVLGEGEK